MKCSERHQVKETYFPDAVFLCYFVDFIFQLHPRVYLYP